MNTSKQRLALAVLAASVPLGCERVLDLVKGLAGRSAPTAPEAPPPPTTAARGQGPSSVRTVAPSRAQGCPATVANAALPPGTVHNGALERDETWSLEDSPHRLPDGIEVHNGATLTLAPCAVVLVGSSRPLRVMEGGGLVAVGDAEHPIRVGSDNPQPQAGDWAHLNFDHNARRTSRLSYVVLEHGGADEVHGARACLSVWAEGLHVDHVTAQHCVGFGVTLQEGGSFSADSSDLTVTGAVAGNAPHTGAVFVRRAPSAASVPPGRYTGNAIDEVYVAEAGNDDGREIRQSQVWRNLGVPYHLADDTELRVEGPTGPVLTINPGVTLRMGRNARFFVGMEAEGGLVMDGNAEETRIVLRPAGTDESPGQWSGLHFGERFNRSATRLRYVTLRNAGGDGSGYLCDWAGESSDRSFLKFDAEPQAASFSHITFAGGGPVMAAVGRNWRSVAVVDFTAEAMGNDFTQWGTGCKQSPLHEASGECPATPPSCP